MKIVEYEYLEKINKVKNMLEKEKNKYVRVYLQIMLTKLERKMSE